MGCSALSTLKNFRFHRPSKLTNNASLSSDARDEQTLVDTVDRISELPDDVLAMILSVIATKDVVKTSVLSKRWKSVWKEVPYLSFDMRKATVTNMEHPAAYSSRVGKTITKVIDNHNVHLEGCTIKNDNQCHSGVLETWIRLLTLEKHTRALSLINRHANAKGFNRLPFSPEIFSHPDLETLWLCLYDLKTAEPFNRCHNLMILKLDKISTEVDVLNTVIASCPSLKVLVLHHVMWDNRRACLKVRNNNLKLLHLACSNVDRIEVHAPLLDIFSLDYHFDAQCILVIIAPRLLFTTNYGPNSGRVQTMVYNISCKAREIDKLGDKFLVDKAANFYQQHKYLAVAVDVMNWKEVEILRNVLVAWNGIKKSFFILFKDKSVSKEEGESSNGG